MDAIASMGASEAETQQYVNLTSLDAMSPDSPVNKVMADLPLAEGITGHSIIAIDARKPADGRGQAKS